MEEGAPRGVPRSVRQSRGSCGGADAPGAGLGRPPGCHSRSQVSASPFLLCLRLSEAISLS